MRFALRHILVLGFSLLVLASRSSYALTPIELQLRWSHQFQFAGFYAAEAQGYYRNAGLSVIMHEGKPGQIASQFVTEKLGRFGIGNSNLLAERAGGKPIVVVSSIFQHSPEILVTLKRSGISHPSDLVGKTVMVRKQEYSSAPIFMAMLASEGANPSKVNWIPHSWNPEDLFSGKVQAMSAYSSALQPEFLKRKTELGFLSPLDYGIDFYGDLLFTSEATEHKMFGATNAFVQASLQGWRYAFDHESEMIDLILGLPGVVERGVTREGLQREAEMTRRLIEPDLIELGYMSDTRWERITEIYKKIGILPHDFSLSGFLLPNRKEVELHRTGLMKRVTLGFLVIAALIALWIFQLRVQVRKKTLALEKASQVKNLFLANMSHEIRTPITSILGFTELLKSSDLKPDQKNHYLSIIERTGRGLATILNDILDIAKVEAGQLEVKITQCNLQELMEDVEHLLQLSASGKGIHLEFFRGQMKTEWVMTDPIRLKQIILNIVGNAIKFTQEGKVIVTYTTTENEIVIRVRDTGVGIPLKSQSRLFQAFTQVDQSFQKDFGGAGLGLSISKNLARLLGGEVSLIRSSPGLGTEFEIRVANSLKPELDPKLALPVENLAPQTSPSLRGKQILVVDDCSDNQMLVKLFLEKEGAAVTLVSNGEEALRVGLAFDLIFMDIQMPILDGYSATAKLRERGYTGPIIALTANGVKEDLNRCLENGCTDYLLKPVKKLELVQMSLRYTQK